MKHISTKLLQIFFLLIFVLSACESSSPEAPVSERIKKTYIVQSVKHDNATVYTYGGSNNISPGYSSFRLDLKTAPQVTLVEVTNDTFKGTYKVSNNTLTLENLSPTPTGSNGIISYQISSINDDGTELVLTSTKANPKTGNTVNVYVLRASL